MQRARLAWSIAEETVLESLRRSPAARQCFDRVRQSCMRGDIAPRSAAELVAAAYHSGDGM